jgi:hypothetical protein
MLTMTEARKLLAVYRQGMSERLARREHALIVPERPVSWSWLPAPASTDLEETVMGTDTTPDLHTPAETRLRRAGELLARVLDDANHGRVTSADVRRATEDRDAALRAYELDGGQR